MDEEIVSSVMAFFVLFFVSLGIIAVLLGLTGLDFVTSVSGAATAIGNIGPGLGDTDRAGGQFRDAERHREVDTRLRHVAGAAGADRRAGPVHRRLLAGLSARQSAKLRLILIWSQAQTTSCRRSSSERSPPFHVRMKNLDQSLVGLADLGLGPVVLGVQDLDGAPFRRRQLAAPSRWSGGRGCAWRCRPGTWCRVLDAEARPSPFPRRIS